MRIVVLGLALCVAGCGGCVDESPEAPPATIEPSGRAHAMGSVRPSTRFARLPGVAIRDAGSGDE